MQSDYDGDDGDDNADKRTYSPFYCVRRQIVPLLQVEM